MLTFHLPFCHTLGISLLKQLWTQTKSASSGASGHQPFHQGLGTTPNQRGLRMSICVSLERAKLDLDRHVPFCENFGNSRKLRLVAQTAGGSGSSGPSSAAASVPGPLDRELIKPLQPLRILIAEDNPANQMLVEALVALGGHSFRTVHDGAKAVHAASTETFDLVLMDVRMPEMSGIEATRRIRELGYSAERLPVIAMTANAGPTDGRDCVEAGMNDILIKPIDRAAFFAKLSDIQKRA
jgi:CheY-like chemotaxis protein